MNTPRNETRIQTVCLSLLTAVVVGAAVHWLRPILVPFVLALFLVIGLTPLVELLMARLRLPRVLAVAVTLVLAILVLGALGLLVSLSIGQPAANAEVYQQRVGELMTRVLDALQLERLGIERQQVRQQLTEWSGLAAGELLLSTGRAVKGILSNGVLVLIFVCFLMLGGSGRTRGLSAEWREIESKVKRYIAVKFILSIATGVLVGLSLWVLGVDMAILFGLLAFLLNFIPSIGSVIAVLLPLPVVLVSPDVSAVTVILAIALPGSVEFVIGNVVEPRLMGKSFDLHPVTILMALIFWGMLWGIIGMLLATPITAVGKILLEKHPMTRPVAELLAGRVR